MQIHFFLTTQQGDVLEVDMRKGNVKDQEKRHSCIVLC